MNEVRKIKQLQSQMSQLQIDVDVLKVEIANKQRELNQKTQSINKLKELIKECNDTSEVKVSEHAILRYFERVKGLNIEDIEKEILTDDVLKLIEKLGGNGKYPVKDFQIVLKNYTVLTIV